MATVAYVVRSDYDPADRKRLEQETGQLSNDDSDPWQKESSLFAQRRVPPPPSFVPATIQYGDWDGSTNSSSSCDPGCGSGTKGASSETAEWYRSLPRTSATPIPARPASAPAPKESSDAAGRRLQSEGINKNNWFISRALHSVPSTAPASPPPSSLADILARDPPPRPSEGRFRPLVWLHIGPGNRGFSMLQRSGWNEGEGLGAHAARLADGWPKAQGVEREKMQSGLRGSASHAAAPSMQGSEPEMAEHQRPTTTREVIDLTQSDPESVDVELEETFQAAPSRCSASMQLDVGSPSPASSLQVSLLTPLPIVLKADRLGIGLKAKTEGPYRRSKKRVTYNAAALAAHVKASEEMRRKKAEVGRGRRGFAKLHKHEEERRKLMLAYLNE